MYVTKYRLISILIIILVAVLISVLVMKPGAKTDSNTDVDVKATTTTLTFRTSPITSIKPFSYTKGAAEGPLSVWTYSDIYKTKKDLWITKINVQLENAPLSLIHHTHIMDMSRANQTCPNSGQPYELFAASTNTVHEPIRFPSGYGLFVPKGTPLHTVFMLFNPKPPYGSGETYKNVYGITTLQAIYGDSDVMHPVEFYRVWIDDTPCDPPGMPEAFAVPVSTSTQTITGDPLTATHVFQKNGTILSVGSNFWPRMGGTTTIGYLNNTKVVSFRSHLADKEKPWSWRIDTLFNANITIKKGDRFSVEAVYTNQLGKPIAGASGMLGFYFAPTNT